MNIRIMAMVITSGIVGGGFYAYNAYATRYPSTDNAFITANVVYVAPQVSGKVSQVMVRDQQYVHKGDVLYTIDARPFKLLLEQERAHLAQTRQLVARYAAAVVSAEAEVKRQEVLLQKATRFAKRSAELNTNKYVSQQATEDAVADMHATQAALAVARAKLNEAREQLGLPGENNQAIREVQAALGKAEWQLQNTTIAASCDGRITQLKLQPGDAVQTGQSNFVLICDHHYWVEANFKETELARIRPGQTVDIKVDMYPGLDLQGVVESINGASGVAFSLLPPQNASGNWVKVTQRVPVKIRVKQTDSGHPLLVGTSAHVRVDTTGGS